MCRDRKFCKLRVIAQTNIRFKHYFYFKDFIPEILCSKLFINFNPEAAQLATLARPTDISK